jgi:predicted MPP superfamily phosphohydrolase
MTSALARLASPILQRRSLSKLRVRHVDLRERGLDLGVRLLLASDLHARNDWFPRPLVARLVDAINEIEGVDLVALLGDFVGNDLSAIDWSAEEYARIEAPVAGVLGNHDHWLDAAYVERTLEQAGVSMLTNRALPLAQLVSSHAGDTWLAGIDSCWTRRGSTGPGADPDTAFADVPAGADVVVLGHEPWLATMHEHVLHVAGHTHCGQVRTPLFGDWTARMHMPRFSEPYPCRLYEVPVEQHTTLPGTHRTARDTRFVYTTAGVGYSTVDVRAFCPPELVVLDC